MGRINGTLAGDIGKIVQAARAALCAAIVTAAKGAAQMLLDGHLDPGGSLSIEVGVVSYWDARGSSGEYCPADNTKDLQVKAEWLGPNQPWITLCRENEFDCDLTVTSLDARELYPFTDVELALILDAMMTLLEKLHE